MDNIISLANGLRVYVDPMPRLDSAAIGVWVRAGAMDEKADENGVAHFLEHMAFKGTQERSARDIAEEIEAVGGHINAATSYPHTGYYARILKQDVDVAFDILADILNNPALDEGELEKEKEVIVQEIGEAWDTPDDALFEILQSLTYGEQALGRPILGGEADVRAHGRTQLRGFMDRQYRPENIVVAASGAVDPQTIVKLAERYFGHLSPSSSISGGQSSSGERNFQHTHGARHEARDLEQTHIAFAAPASGVCDEDYFAMRIFAEILGGGMSSRLFQEVREKRGLAYSVYAYADAYDDIGTLGVYLGVDAGAAEEAVKISLDQIASMADNVSEKELARARAMLRSSLLMGLESPLNRAERACSQLFTFGAMLSTQEICDKLDQVSIADIKRCAHAISGHAQKSLAVVGPADFERIKGAL